MKIKKIEETLLQMTKPEVSQLKHQDMLAAALIKAKDKSVLSWWWLSVPLYIISTLIMKSFFMTKTTWISNIRELTSQEKYSSVLFFLVLPIVFIVINYIGIRNIYLVSGSPKTINFLKKVWFNVLIIIFSILILIIYSL